MSQPRMLSEPFSPAVRELKTKRLEVGLVVVGGGLAGSCAALTAARAGVSVALVQDRPVLGGNASSEVRLWGLGATSHMGNNNRWAREGGVINEILVENLYRNPEGNALIFDTVLLEKVLDEPNITLLLNTSAHVVRKRGSDSIESVQAFCSQNSTLYDLQAPLFCDSSGDGVVAFQAGAAFRARRPATNSAKSSRPAPSTATCWATPSTFTARTWAARCALCRRATPSMTSARFRASAASTRRPTAAACGGSNTAGASTRCTRPRPSSGSCGAWSTACGTTSRIRASSRIRRT